MDKQPAWEKLKQDCESFTQQTYPNDAAAFVFGEGNLDADIFMIGEAPGHHEVEQKRPFVGQAGVNLNEFLVFLGLNRPQLYVTNTVKLQTTRQSATTTNRVNRTPDRLEVRNYHPFLQAELELIRPKFVLTLGNIALQGILQDFTANIGAYHGNPQILRDFGMESVLFPLYHPASVIYNRKLKDVYFEDLQCFKRIYELTK